MKYNYGIYASGKASRIIEFYSNKYRFERFTPLFIYYDGLNKEVIEQLQNISNEKFRIITPTEKYSSVKELSLTVNKELLFNLKKYRTDYLFCFGDKILKSELVTQYKNKIINFHPAILPAFKGLNAIDQALNSSVQLLGNTAHFIDEKIDNGPIILQSVISRSNYKDYYSVLDLQIPMLEKIWNWLENNLIEVENNKVIIKAQINNQSFFSI